MTADKAQIPPVRVESEDDRVRVFFDTPSGISISFSLEPVVAAVLARDLARAGSEAE